MEEVSRDSFVSIVWRVLPLVVALHTPAMAEAAVDAKELARNQTIRDTLFRNLKSATTEYTFDYVVINLPAGSLPGVDATVPVSHIRFKSTVFFGFDKFSLEASAERAVADLARNVLADRSAQSLLIVGHTDAIGADEYNAGLSMNRAVTVAAKLRELGVNAKLLGVVPMGEAQPVATNRSAEGRSQNRRVEFFISDVPGAPHKAIERINFNPCHRNDHEVPLDQVNPDCGKETRVPVFSGSGRGRPEAMLNLSRAPLATTSIPNNRIPLPNEILQRPSLKELTID